MSKNITLHVLGISHGRTRRACQVVRGSVQPVSGHNLTTVQAWSDLCMVWPCSGVCPTSVQGACVCVASLLENMGGCVSGFVAGWTRPGRVRARQVRGLSGLDQVLRVDGTWVSALGVSMV